MTPEMKAIALRVAKDCVCPCGMQSKESLLEFAERFLAALPKPEPIGYVRQYAIDHLTKPGQTVINHVPLDVTDIALYAAPQDTAAIEQRVAEACAKYVATRAKIEKSKAVSSRYSGAIAAAPKQEK